MSNAPHDRPAHKNKKSMPQGVIHNDCTAIPSAPCLTGARRSLLLALCLLLSMVAPSRTAAIPQSDTTPPPAATATTDSTRQPGDTAAHITAETVMQQVFTYVEREHLGEVGYTSDVYVRHRAHTKRRGQVVRYLPNMFRLERGTHDYLTEAQLQFQHRPGGATDCRVSAFHTTARYLSPKRMADVAQFNFQIYSPTLFSDNLLNPLHRRNRRFYRYALRYFTHTDSIPAAHIEIMPRYEGEQFVRNGFIDVSLATGRVVRFRFRFRNRLQHFTVTGRPGSQGHESLLPEQLRIIATLRLMGNKVNEVFDVSARHRVQRPAPPATMPHAADSLIAAAHKSAQPHSPSPLDLTQWCMLRIDTAGIITRRDFFTHRRPIPLRGIEARIYADADSIAIQRRRRADADSLAAVTDLHRLLAPWFAAGADSVSIPIGPAATPSDASPAAARNTRDILLSSHTFRFGPQRGASLRLPAMFTPSMLQWSGSKGLSLQARIGFTLQLPRMAGTLQFTPRVGYSFKQKQIYWNVPLTIDLWPAASALLRLQAEGGDHIYSSRQADAVRQSLAMVVKRDSLMQRMNSYDFFLYRALRLRAEFSLSPSPGLRIMAGMRLNRHTPLVWTNEPAAAAAGITHRRLTSLAPVASIEFTPRQPFYRQNGRRVPLPSPWPTFAVTYERGATIGTAATAYERIEGEMHHQFSLPAMRTLSLRVAGGGFTQRSADCFLDYDNFRFNSMPSTWDDDMAGEFQLLSSRWYNESRHYAFASAAYESPLLFLGRLPWVGRLVRRERLYANVLTLRTLGFYAEPGYGLSTDLFDIALFTSLSPKQHAGVGVRFVFRLFDAR